MCVSINRCFAALAAAVIVYAVSDPCNASVTVSQPTVTAAGAKPDDQKTAIPAAMTEKQCTGTQCPVAKAEGPKKFCYAGSGRVVDDKTGKPVELFAYQEGLPNSKYPSGTLWAFTYGAHRRRGGQFSISHNIVRGGKVRVRVLAYGYVPEVVIAETNKEGRLLENPLVVRLRRGKEVRGRVLDHQGKPVVGARVFLQGKGRLVALHHRISRLGVKPVSTDSDGRFVTTGGGEPVTHVIVYAPHLNIWAVPIPEDLGELEGSGSEGLTVRLPQPATLKVVFDIPGAVDKNEVHVQEFRESFVPAGGKAQLQLNLKKLHGEGWKGATDACQMARVANPGEVVIDNLAPGVYDFRRTINLETRGGRGMRSRSCGRRDITLRPGETQVVRFVRDKGQRVRGEIQGLPEGSSDALITVSPLGDPGKTGKREPFDWVSCERDGSFVTPLLAPGEYRLTASVHAPPKPRGDASWRIPTPDDVGAVNVTIKESGPPVEVRIEIKPRSAGRTATSSADGRATLAPKPAKAATKPTVEAAGPKQDNQTPAADAESSSSSSSSSSLPQWGEAVDGVQVRLRAKQSTWNEGAVPRLWADVRNQGKRDLLVRTRDHGCELEVDGQWYRWPDYGGTIPPPRPLPPGRRYDDIAVVLGRFWLLAAPPNTRPPWKTGPQQLGRLTPGKHTIRVAFAVTAAQGARGKPLKAISNPVEIEIVAKSDEKVDATPEGNTSTPAAEPKLDGKEILDKLKSIDAVYAAAFTASGTRPGWPGRKWKFTMFRGRIALEEEVVEIPKHSGPTQVGRFIAFRSTWYFGPTAQATYAWVGRIPRYGPLEPWPENDPGPATSGSLKVDDPDAPTYTLHIQRTLLCLGRGYSKYITKIRDVSPQEDGRLKVAADGIDCSFRPGAKWELVIDPDAEYMVRSAQVVDSRNRRRLFTNSGLTRHGPHCVPQKGECKGAFISTSFRFQSASFEADVEFLKRAKATMQPPYLIRTDVSDQRRTPELRIQYEGGKMSPRGGKPGFDLGLEKEAASDMKEVPAGEPTAEAKDLKPDEQATAAEPKLDGKEILDKLKSIDAVYAAAFSASGTRPGWPKRKWKFTMFRGRIALEEEVVEIPKPKETTKKSRYGPTQKGRFIAMRSTFYVGPTAQAKYDWVGRIPRYGPLDPWPQNGPGPATAGSLNVDDPDAPTYMLPIKRTLWCLGRGYSKYIIKIRNVSRQEDGRLKVAADGLNMSLRPGAKWELVIQPDAEYMVRSAKMDYRNRRSSFTNSGLKRHGPHCVPEKGECKGGFISASFEFQSASFEADVEFLRRAKATMQPPYLIHTDVSDQRKTPELMIQYDAGKTSPQGGKPDWKFDLEKEAVFDMEEGVPGTEGTGD